jgi:Ca2+:H+ antiporter
MPLPACRTGRRGPGEPLILGLEPTGLVLLMLTFAVGTLTLGPGRTTVLQGAVHIVILAAFVVLTAMP